MMMQLMNLLRMKETDDFLALKTDIYLSFSFCNEVIKK